MPAAGVIVMSTDSLETPEVLVYAVVARSDRATTSPAVAPMTAANATA
ncbi:Uncharacterised protein [Mycobacterium tuberculosis]|uniref:Uncharacterized protein n=1 Tax=Mycobacterium tuberculosis TaxID=1773 RepID=A0A654TUI4_MYCTX|nr:Uncharacterised protein [Mycobacterium tuberculosis]CKT15982.1 Uncharacterised protein [Mycobacterium tuberculosis]CKT49245.1 Uncharacterised protein [Mycobacterium tuberculosis]CNW46270.1 Uncharacterised protein [Mycobacterium tuberculosis]COV84218.1 Uncharacterised protein [Mycobacterium tuberculosis]